MKEDMRNFTSEERSIADEVADNLLTLDSKEDKKYFFLILLFLICLIFLVSSLSFAIFRTYYNGTKNNVIDVNVNVDDKPDDNDDDKIDDNKDDNTSDDNIDDNKDDEIDDGKDDNVPGTVLFSFNSGSNYIDMKDVYPTSDAIGRNLTGDKQYFDFNISTTINDNSEGTMYYEIALIPEKNNTISENDVRVYLTENNKAVSLFDDEVVNFSQLPVSQYHENGRVIYRSSVNNNSSINYVFRMWLSESALVDDVSRQFGCKIVVDAYYR